MASKNHFITAKTNITSNDDLLPCMVDHHLDWEQLKKNSFGADDKCVVKCNCEDPATEHVGTYLEGATNYDHAGILTEMAKAEWTDPDL